MARKQRRRSKGQRTPKRGHARTRAAKGKREKTTFLVVCEGSKSEPGYFKELGKGSGKVAITTKGGDKCGTDPVQIVEYALNRGEGFDEVWAVFDHDLRDKEALDRAFQLAENAEIKVAFSNPCFELWYILHFADQRAHLKDCNAAVRALNTELKKSGLEEYSKSKELFERLKDRRDLAIERAVGLRKKHRDDGKDENENPSTSVDKLAQTILDKM